MWIEVEIKWKWNMSQMFIQFKLELLQLYKWSVKSKEQIFKYF